MMGNCVLVFDEPEFVGPKAPVPGWMHLFPRNSELASDLVVSSHLTVQCLTLSNLAPIIVPDECAWHCLRAHAGMSDPDGLMKETPTLVSLLLVILTGELAESPV
jgi:hypothetical protein